MDKETTDKWIEWLHSEEGEKSMKEWADKLAKEHEVKIHQMVRAKKMFSNPETFAALVDSIIEMHDDDYVDRSRKRGYEAGPNNLMTVLFLLSEEEGKEVGGVDNFSINWPSSNFEYMDHVFSIVFGQGSAFCIYRNGERIFTI